MSSSPDSHYVTALTMQLREALQAGEMVVRYGPWQPPLLLGMRGTRVADPHDPIMVLCYETPISMSATPSVLDKQGLELLHIQKFSTDMQLGSGTRPYSDLRPGQNPPDFLGTRDGALCPIDCTQFGLQTRRSAQAQFAQIRATVAGADPVRFAHLRGLLVYVWVRTDDGPAERPLTRPHQAALLAALEAYRFDPEKMPKSGVELPEKIAELDTISVGGWGFVARPIGIAVPHAPFCIKMGFEMGFVQNSDHVPSNEWEEIGRLIGKHDKPEIQELIVTFGAPDRSSLIYPSEEAVFDFMLEHPPAQIVTQHLKRVIAHGWGTGRIVQLVPDFRELAAGYSPGIVPSHMPLNARTS